MCKWTTKCCNNVMKGWNKKSGLSETREGMKKQINYKKIAETHHQCYKAQKEQFQHTDKTVDLYQPRLQRQNTLEAGERHSSTKKRPFFYTGIYTSIHSYPNKLTHKRKEQQEELYILHSQMQGWKGKKARQHTGTLSPKSSDKY